MSVSKERNCNSICRQLTRTIDAVDLAEVRLLAVDP